MSAALVIAGGFIGGALWYAHEVRIAEAQSLLRFPFGGEVKGSIGCSSVCNPVYDGRVIIVNTVPFGVQLRLLVSDRTTKFKYRQTGPPGIKVLGWAEVNPANQLCFNLDCGSSGCDCDYIFSHAWVERYGSSHTP